MELSFSPRNKIFHVLEMSPKRTANLYVMFLKHLFQVLFSRLLLKTFAAKVYFV
jgi:hypothetical protein